MNITDLLQKCVNYGAKALTTTDIVNSLSISRYEAYKELKQLAKRGKVYHVKHGRHSHWMISMEPSMPTAYNDDIKYRVRSATPNRFNEASVASMTHNCVRPTITPFNYIENEDISYGFSIMKF